MVRLPKLFGSSSTRRSFLRSSLAAPAVIGAGLAAHPSTAAFAGESDAIFSKPTADCKLERGTRTRESPIQMT
jgi:hypothetical protein